MGTLLNDELEPIGNVDDYLDNLNINSLDVLFWLFKVQILQPLMQSKVFEQIKPMLEHVQGVFNINAVSADDLLKVDHIEGA